MRRALHTWKIYGNCYHHVCSSENGDISSFKNSWNFVPKNIFHNLLAFLRGCFTIFLIKLKKQKSSRVMHAYLHHCTVSTATCICSQLVLVLLLCNSHIWAVHRHNLPAKRKWGHYMHTSGIHIKRTHVELRKTHVFHSNRFFLIVGHFLNETIIRKTRWELWRHYGQKFINGGTTQ